MYHFSSIILVNIEKNNNMPEVVRMQENSSCNLAEWNVNFCDLWRERNMEIAIKIKKYRLPFDPIFSLLRIYPIKIKALL